MKARAGALLVAAIAVGLHVGVTRPMRARAAAYADAFGAARVERQDLTQRLAELQRRSRARARAMAAVAGAGSDPAVTTRAVRQSVAEAVRGSRASGVRLSIRPSDAGIDVSVLARGSATEILDLTGQLARPEFGVVLERVTLTRDDGRVNLQLKGLGIAATR